MWCAVNTLFVTADVSPKPTGQVSLIDALLSAGTSAGSAANGLETDDPTSFAYQWQHHLDETKANSGEWHILFEK